MLYVLLSKHVVLKQNDFFISKNVNSLTQKFILQTVVNSTFPPTKKLYDHALKKDKIYDEYY